MSTDNPFMIMVINMTIVFSVLYILSLLIQLVHFIDPTKKKKKAKRPASPAPRKVSAPVVVDDMGTKTEIAIITAALVAYGCKNFEIKSIKKLT